MKSWLTWFIFLFLSGKVLTLLKVLEDVQSNCPGLICDYSFVGWKEKIEILHANNELRNIIADGYSADITTAAINKLAWSEKLSSLAQDEANKCPKPEVWTYSERNDECEFASMKAVRKSLRLQRNFTSFFDDNRMMDFDVDLFDGKRKLRRGSAYSIGCGYVLRYFEEKLIDHFVCLYCYVNRKQDYISFNGNRSCQQDCLYENFTCDRIYNHLCSYEGKDGNIEARHKPNPICPKVNVLTGTMLFWNFLGLNVTCLLASIFWMAAIIIGTAQAVYVAMRNYETLRMLFSGKIKADDDSPIQHSTVDSINETKFLSDSLLHTVSLAPGFFTVKNESHPSAQSNQSMQLSTSKSTSTLSDINDVVDNKWWCACERIFIEKSTRSRNEACEGCTRIRKDIKSNIISNTKTSISGHKVAKGEEVLSPMSKRIAASKIIVQSAPLKSTRGVESNRKCVSDPLYEQPDSSDGSSKCRKTSKLGLSHLLRQRQQQQMDDLGVKGNRRHDKKELA